MFFLWEEPGFVIQEAAACKKIILTSNCESGPSEFLNHGKMVIFLIQMIRRVLLVVSIK